MSLNIDSILGAYQMTLYLITALVYHMLLYIYGNIASVVLNRKCFVVWYQVKHEILLLPFSLQIHWVQPFLRFSI